MYENLIIENNTMYLVDEDCIKCKQKAHHGKERKLDHPDDKEKNEKKHLHIE